MSFDEADTIIVNVSGLLPDVGEKDFERYSKQIRLKPTDTVSQLYEKLQESGVPPHLLPDYFWHNSKPSKRYTATSTSPSYIPLFSSTVANLPSVHHIWSNPHSKSLINVDTPLRTHINSRALPCRINYDPATSSSSSLEIDGGNLSIHFHRTLRLPDDDNLHQLPASLGEFPLFNVGAFEKRLPGKIVRRGGVFFPMWAREALWIEFRVKTQGDDEGGRGGSSMDDSGLNVEEEPVLRRKYAIRPYIGAVNAITGHLMKNKEKEKLKMDVNDGGMELDSNSDSENFSLTTTQDYIVVPGQPWLDGICVEEGVVRQFVAMPLGSGYTVEGQKTGEEKHGGLQLEIIPMDTQNSYQFQASTNAGLNRRGPRGILSSGHDTHITPGYLGLKEGDEIMISEYRGTKLSTLGDMLQEDYGHEDRFLPKQIMAAFSNTRVEEAKSRFKAASLMRSSTQSNLEEKKVDAASLPAEPEARVERKLLAAAKKAEKLRHLREDRRRKKPGKPHQADSTKLKKPTKGLQIVDWETWDVDAPQILRGSTILRHTFAVEPLLHEGHSMKRPVIKAPIPGEHSDDSTQSSPSPFPIMPAQQVDVDASAHAADAARVPTFAPPATLTVDSMPPPQPNPKVVFDKLAESMEYTPAPSFASSAIEDYSGNSLEPLFPLQRRRDGSGELEDDKSDSPKELGEREGTDGGGAFMIKYPSVHVQGGFSYARSGEEQDSPVYENFVRSVDPSNIYKRLAAPLPPLQTRSRSEATDEENDTQMDPSQQTSAEVSTPHPVRSGPSAPKQETPSIVGYHNETLDAAINPAGFDLKASSHSRYPAVGLDPAIIYQNLSRSEPTSPNGSGASPPLLAETTEDQDPGPIANRRSGRSFLEDEDVQFWAESPPRASVIGATTSGRSRSGFRTVDSTLYGGGERPMRRIRREGDPDGELSPSKKYSDASCQDERADDSDQSIDVDYLDRLLAEDDNDIDLMAELERDYEDDTVNDRYEDIDIDDRDCDYEELSLTDRRRLRERMARRDEHDGSSNSDRARSMSNEGEERQDVYYNMRPMSTDAFWGSNSGSRKRRLSASSDSLPAGDGRTPTPEQLLTSKGPHLRRGASQPLREVDVRAMGIAPGGKLIQDIIADSSASTVWNTSGACLLNIHIFDSASFETVTHVVPPPTPVSIAEYVRAGIPFYHVEEKVGRRLKAGDFEGVLSVGQMDAEKLEEENEEDERFGGNLDTGRPRMCNQCLLSEDDFGISRLCDCVIRPCNHTFCNQCIMKIASDPALNINGEYSCPECGTGVLHVAGFAAPMNLPGEDSYDVDIPVSLLNVDDGRVQFKSIFTSTL